MCGIVGYIGANDAKSILLDGLDTLEYRGYDSAGIYVTDSDNQGHLFKEEGRIASLRNTVDDSITAFSGIGHTRWATHGKPSVNNAHPHQSKSGRFSIVHNGVIENFIEVRETYLPNAELVSDTDTEIIVQFIAQLVEEDGMETLDAFKKAVKVLDGSYAVALVDSMDPDTLYAAKNKSPLLLGTGEGFNVISSDAMAMIKQTNNFIEIMDEEVATLTKDSIHIETLDGETVERDSYVAEIDVNDLGKGTYPHYMIKEIDEQPIVMRKLIQNYQNDNGELEIDESILSKMKQSDRIYIVAAGTSYNAGLIGKKIFESITQIPTEVHLASEFAYNMPLLSEHPYFIFLSQSGETADSRQVLVQTNKLNHPSLTITNVKGSTLSREANDTLLLHAGPEIAVASTKAYTAQIAVMAILSDVYARYNKLETTIDIAHELGLVANTIEAVIDDANIFEDIAKENLVDSKNAFYIGRGSDYHLVLEGALKLKEISYIQAEGWASGELKHGTIALIEEGVPVVSIITDKNTALLTRSNAHEVISRGANSIILAMDGMQREEDSYVIPQVHQLLTPLVSVVPTQLLAYYTALHRGNDVDKPRNLAKAVTVE